MMILLSSVFSIDYKFHEIKEGAYFAQVYNL